MFYEVKEDGVLNVNNVYYFLLVMRIYVGMFDVLFDVLFVMLDSVDSIGEIGYEKV